jgi:hypothetical protein
LHLHISLFVFGRHPAIPRAGEERGELADRLGVFVFVADTLRIRAAPPLGESDDVSWSILIDENLMRDMARKAPHIRPHLTCEAESSSSVPGFSQVSQTTVTIYFLLDIVNAMRFCRLTDAVQPREVRTSPEIAGYATCSRPLPHFEGAEYCANTSAPVRFFVSFANA